MRLQPKKCFEASLYTRGRGCYWYTKDLEYAKCPIQPPYTRRPTRMPDSHVYLWARAWTLDQRRAKCRQLIL